MSNCHIFYWKNKEFVPANDGPQLFDETVQAFAGIEYDTCCWRVRLIGQQLLTDVNDDPVNSVLVQFQLKGLGGWGSADDEFLEDNIAGYQTNR